MIYPPFVSTNPVIAAECGQGERRTGGSKSIEIEITQNSKLGFYGNLKMSNSTIQAAIKKGWFGLDRMALIWTGDLSTELTIDGTIHEGFDISQKGADDSFLRCQMLLVRIRYISAVLL